MSTNFYLRAKPCDKCALSPPDIHLGKRSAGWRFLVQGYRGEMPGYMPAGVTSWADLQALCLEMINNGWRIVDDYDRELTFGEFKTEVDATQLWRGLPSKNHCEYMAANHPDAMEDEAVDAEGWPVSFREFS